MKKQTQEEETKRDISFAVKGLWVTTAFYEM